ncbi:MAG TPA: hypothetical protein VN906_04915 [Candidatus Sulfotelmatobacter sp.]|nr:hypothetical protein [Candidatus Sulfotelmatobacter sp.]
MLVAGVGLSTLLLLAVADLFLTFDERPSVGEWVTQWARRYPLFALALTLLAGALVGHFYWATAG